MTETRAGAYGVNEEIKYERGLTFVWENEATFMDDERPLDERLALAFEAGRMIGRSERHGKR